MKREGKREERRGRERESREHNVYFCDDTPSLIGEATITDGQRGVEGFRSVLVCWGDHGTRNDAFFATNFSCYFLSF